MVARFSSVALVLASMACLTSATPIPACAGDACNQAVQTGNVQLGSTTTIVPQTNVVPITNYQPIVRAGSPIVLADNLCEGSSIYANPACLLGGMGTSAFAGASAGAGIGMGHNVRIGPFLGGSSLFPGRAAPFSPLGIRRGSLVKRRVKTKGPEAECVPSATVSCETSVPGGSVDMGSHVTAVPKVAVEPNTIYKGAVEAKAAAIEAAPAEHTQLSQESVSLGGNVDIQPVTEVRPEHTYAPAVTSLPTEVYAEAPTYQALDRSSVSLGSSVHVQPTTTVRPLTVYQPSIKSLPFKITQITACDEAYLGHAPRLRHHYRPSYLRSAPMRGYGSCL